ncbi:MAG: tetratricopeptide repeat protein [Streptosporangiales bacterium]|nr:tetratricopeptide repeat protein [Streptosporangiales bacterium]
MPAWTVATIAAPSLVRGRAALAAGRWEEAVHDLTEALGRASSAPDQADAAVGLSDALWWLGQVDEALAAREHAYAAWRRLGDDIAAAHAAVWLAREYAEAIGNQVASAGWLARTETLVAGPSGSNAVGWVALTRAALAPDPAVQEPAAREAVAYARAGRDGDLEVLALARLGLATVSVGRIDDGLQCFDEAMAAATGGGGPAHARAAVLRPRPGH